MDPSRIAYKNSSVAWYRFGRGPQAVICFHGYGETGLSFQFLETSLAEKFSFYAIDLPFHGETQWKEGLEFSTKDLVAIISTIIPEDRFGIIGYSLGGRVGLSLYESVPEKISRMVLLAPDGLKVNSWYWFATQTRAGATSFRFTMKHPSWFFVLLKTFNRLGLVNASIYKFTRYYIESPRLRELLYQRWITLRNLRPRLTYIKALIRKENTIVRIVYGKHDRIILSSVGNRFCKGLESQCMVTVIPSGHQLLHEKHAAEIRTALLG